MQINNNDVNLTSTLLNLLFRINNMIHQVKDTIIVLNIAAAMQCRYGGKLNAGIYIYKSVCGCCLDEAETGIRVYVSDGIE